MLPGKNIFKYLFNTKEGSNRRTKEQKNKDREKIEKWKK